MNPKLVRWGLTALMVGTLAACGGGGGGTTTAAAPAAGGAGGAVAAAGAPVGTAVVTAAAAAPATTNTAANPAQAFALVNAAGGAAVTVNSPPVLNFTVIDSTGKFVSGLKLANTAAASSAAASTADPICGGANVTAAIAKFDGSNWQSLISRQRLAADSKTQFAVVEGTTDPKPTAGGQTITKADGTKVTGQIKNADDAAAIADPTKRVVGVLQENTAGGYYTYYFATDVSKALAMADAVDVQNVTQGKLANNGNLAVKDGKTIHRVGLQLCYTDPASKAKITVNPTYDFTIGSNGIATPVLASDGKTYARGNAVVDTASCNECHEKLAVHGNILTANPRINTDYCVICHNVGSKDYNTQPASGDVNAASSISLKSMIHMLHAGKTWLTAKNYKIVNLAFKATDASGNVTGTAFPQDVRNCTKCHDNTVAAQADNWKNVPTRLACGSCHDGIDFTTGKGTTLADYAAGKAATSLGHIGGAKKDDSQCVLCHDATTIPIYHQTTIATPHNPTVKSGVGSFEFKLASATLNASNQVVVKFQVLKNGSAVKFNDYVAGGVLITGYTGTPRFVVMYSTAQDGIANPSDWNASLTVNLTDVWASSFGNSLTLSDAATNTYTAVLAGVSATQNATVPNDAKMLTVAMARYFTDATYGNLPGKAAMMTVSGNTPDGKANVARRVIFNESSCNTCHDRLGSLPSFHSGAYNVALCAGCHTPNGTNSGWSYSFRVWVHGIHGNSRRTVPYSFAATLNKDGATPQGYWQVGYPGVLRNCETCHLEGTYDFSASQYTADLIANMLYVTNAAGKLDNTGATTWYKMPQTKNPDTVVKGGQTYAYGSSLKLPGRSGALVVDNTTDFGTGWSVDKTTNKILTGAAVTTQANNLVSSPITAVCSSCHDDAAALTHMTTTGYGSFYRPRGTAGVTDANTALGSSSEQCMFCHGPGKTLPIKTAHNPAWDLTVSPIKTPW